MFRIVEEPIQPDALNSQVARAYNGAVVTFAGIVRNCAEDGSPTAFLIYEAYREMAEVKMAEIGQEICRRWNIQDIAILHRIGRLEIGDICVLIAVASPHRAEGFEACRYAIDRLKEIVPIWKKEVGEKGTIWVGTPFSGSAGA